MNVEIFKVIAKIMNTINKAESKKTRSTAAVIHEMQKEYENR